MSSVNLANRLLIANRGEIAIRIARTAGELGIHTIAIHAEDDGASLHTRQTDEVCALKGIGAPAYLDQAQVIEVAKANDCDAIHPGYGFLSENSEFAARCRDENIVFVGPSPETLSLFGDKISARKAAQDAKVPVLSASEGAISLDEAKDFLTSLGENGAMMLKAIGGGGGRGMRIVRHADELEEALERCSSEAQSAFGNGDLYAEALVSNALHIEVQIIANSNGGVSHLYERDCSLQRRHQKLVEIAPSPQLPVSLRSHILNAAVNLAYQAGYNNIGTFEFLVDGSDLGEQSPFFFMEANPRLQVEHTVTEEITGVDLVRTQLELAAGASLSELGLTQEEVPPARGYAMQLRVNMEAISADAVFKPTGGTLSAFDPPTGPGVRVDTFGYAGYQTSPHYDSLLAKVITSTSRNNFDDVVRRARRALTEFQIDGIPTNIDFLQKILAHEKVAGGSMMTDFIDEKLLEINALETGLPQRYIASVSAGPAPATQVAGATIDTSDPLAVLAYGKSKADSPSAAPTQPIMPDGTQPVIAAMQATIVSLAVKEGDLVAKGEELLVVNSMKMEHVIKAEISGVVKQILVQPGVTVAEGAPLLFIEEADVERTDTGEVEELDLENPRPDLAEVIRLREFTTDESRAERIEKGRKRGYRSTRENIADLCDDGSFLQYGSLAVSPGYPGITIEELLDYDASDGMVMGLGHINGHLFDETKSRAVIMAYDWTVLAGTQGFNHKLKDRMYLLANELDSPLVLFATGGGGRAGGGSMAGKSAAATRKQSAPQKEGSDEKDAPAQSEWVGAIPGGVSGMHCESFTYMAKLHGRAPMIGICGGICFAGNAVLLSLCDVIIATANSNIGIGGPAMIEGGGLGIYRPDEIGPMSEQVPNGVVDIAVADEVEAVAVAKKYLTYFQGNLEDWACADQRLLRHAVPENRLRVYDIRKLIETLADTDSVMEIRAGFGLTMITALARIEGRPVGIVANNTVYKGGAIDSDGADKASRFIKLCDNFNIPIVTLNDCPGIMVGPEDEKTALVRHAGRMFVVCANITVPMITVVLRKSYGLGGQAMGGGTHSLPHAVVAWPTSEFGPMGLEGQVKLGMIATLEAIEDPAERQKTYERLVADLYYRGKGIWAAHGYEVDDMIDPADTRKWIMAALKAQPPWKTQAHGRPKGHIVDVW